MYLDDVSKGFDIGSLCLDQFLHNKRASPWPYLTHTFLKVCPFGVETEHHIDGLLCTWADGGYKGGHLSPLSFTSLCASAVLPQIFTVIRDGGMGVP